MVSSWIFDVLAGVDLRPGRRDREEDEALAEKGRAAGAAFPPDACVN